MTPINIKKNFKFIFLTILEVKIKYRQHDDFGIWVDLKFSTQKKEIGFFISILRFAA